MTHPTKESYTNSTVPNASPSAQQMVPVLLELFNPQSVVDIGCRQGVWLREFEQHSIQNYMGIDYAGFINNEALVIPAEKFQSIDLTIPGAVEKTADKKFDLAICLEVAEHLPEESAAQLIDLLTLIAPIVIFSAAIPFQGGVNHFNEQWPSYWVNLFNKKDFEVVDCLRPKFWNNDQIKYWYRQNTLAFIKKDLIASDEKLKQLRNNHQPHASKLDIVHPEMWQNMRARLQQSEQHVAYLSKANEGIKVSLRNLLTGLKRKLFFWKK